MDSSLKKWNKNNFNSFFNLWKGFWFGFSELILVFSSAYFITFVGLFYTQPEYLRYTFLISLVFVLIVMVFLKYDIGLPVIVAKTIGSIMVLGLFIGQFLFTGQSLILAFIERFHQAEAIVNKSGSVGVLSILSWVLMLAIPLYLLIGIVYLSEMIGKWIGLTVAKIFSIIGLALLVIIWFTMRTYLEEANFVSIAESHSKILGYLIGVSLIGIHASFLVNMIFNRKKLII